MFYLPLNSLKSDFRLDKIPCFFLNFSVQTRVHRFIRAASFSSPSRSSFPVTPPTRAPRIRSTHTHGRLVFPLRHTRPEHTRVGGESESLNDLDVCVCSNLPYLKAPKHSVNTEGSWPRQINPNLSQECRI